MRKFIAAVLIFGVSPCLADGCIDYKLRPKIRVTAPQWSKSVVQPLRRMDLLHGNVIATFVENYDVVADITSIEDGFCVALKEVNATIGYSDFQVHVDISHVPGSCEYDAIVEHEDSHIRAYLSVADDFTGDATRALYAAAAAVTPVFVRSADELDAAVDALHDALVVHPELVLLTERIHAEEEIRNKRVDRDDDGAALRQCGAPSASH